MYLEDCVTKEIFGSFDRSKLPPNLHGYNCELCIEEYAQGPVTEEVKYFKFTPNANTKGQPFEVRIDNVAKPKNVIFSYKMAEDSEKQTAEIILGPRVQFKLQTTVIESKLQINHVIEEDEGGQDSYNFADVDEDMLRPHPKLVQVSDQEANISQQSRQLDRSDVEIQSMKTELIQFLHSEQNRKAKFKDMRQYLESKGHKLSEQRVKVLITEICQSNVPDKRFGFSLRPIYYDREEYERRNPKKKVKDE